MQAVKRRRFYRMRVGRGLSVLLDPYNLDGFGSLTATRARCSYYGRWEGHHERGTMRGFRRRAIRATLLPP